MKLVLMILIILFLCSVFSNLAAREDYKIYQSKTGKEISLNQMAMQLAKQNVIFFGEYHDDAVCHQLEMELLQELYKIKPDLIVSFEMFERDVQQIIDNYLANNVDEAAFLAESRPWPNYETDYKPMLEFAKLHKLPVIAANVPRKYASMIAKGNKDALTNVPKANRGEFASKLIVLDDEYKVDFINTMMQNMGHGMPANASAFDNLYAAQCLKDDTMAESIRAAIKKHGNKKSIVIHYNGDFHSRFKRGTAQKLHLLSRKIRIAVISPSYVDSTQPLEWDSNLSKDGDYIILIPKQTDPKE